MEEGILSRPRIDLCYSKIRTEFSLTNREIEILHFIIHRGLNNRELALELGIAEKTVKNHIANILGKTLLSSTRQLQALVFRLMFSEIYQSGHDSVVYAKQWGN